MKILIVDDNKENLYLLNVMLTSRRYTVVSTENGMEAWEKLQEDNFDLIISDILMPVMDGFTLCRKCKEDEKLRNIPFVFYTATYKDEKDEELALKMGADRYILKPMEPQEFLNIIQGLFEEIEKGKMSFSKPAAEKVDNEIYKLYSERLVEKLESKMLALESETTQRKKTEVELRSVNRLLHTIRNVNQLIVRENSREKILKGICRILRDTGGYSATWVALIDGANKLTEVAEVGLGRHIQPLINALRQGQLTYCAEKAISQSEAVVIKPRTQDDCKGCVLPKSQLLHTSICIRLEYQKRIYGVLYALSRRNIDLPEEERKLFDEMAHDIAFALHKIELAEKHRQATKALRDSEERYKGLVNHVNIGILRSTAGPPGKVLEINPAFEEITGYSRAELMALDITKLYFHPKDRVDILNKLASGDNAITRELLWRKNDGTPISILDRITAIKDTSGEILYLDAIVEDITERKKTETELAKSYATLKKTLNDAINTMAKIV